MPVPHSRGRRGFILFQFTHDTVGDPAFPGNHRDHFQCHGAWAQDQRNLARDVGHSRLQPDVARPAVQHQGDQPVKVVQHVPGCRRAGASGAVGTGGGDRHTADPQQFTRGRMAWRAQRDRFKPGADLRGDHCLPFDDQGQRPRPERVCEQIRQPVPFAAGTGSLFIRHVYDQGIVRGPAFRLKDPSHRFHRKRICPKAVHRFRRKGDQAALSQDISGLGDALPVGGQALCSHVSSILQAFCLVQEKQRKRQDCPSACSGDSPKCRCPPFFHPLCSAGRCPATDFYRPLSLARGRGSHLLTRTPFHDLWVKTEGWRTLQVISLHGDYRI